MSSDKKKNILVFSLLIVFTIFLEYIAFKPHLRYAFADVDWLFLLGFKELGAQYANPIFHLITGWKVWGVYTYQGYYIGLINYFFGFNYEAYQIITLIFKIVATLSVYPLILVVTKSRLAAFLTTILYAVAYSSMGVLYTVVTSGLFVSIPVMNTFFIWYWFILTKDKNGIRELVILVFLFFSTLILATERMYPLVPTVLIIELFWWYKNDFSRKTLIQGLKRLFALFFLFALVFIYRPSTFTLLSGNVGVTYQKFVLGNWQVILTPIISYGSLFIPKDYWPLFGAAIADNISNYVKFVLTGPLIFFSIVTFFLAFFVSSKPFKFGLSVLGFFISFSALNYLLTTHHLTITELNRMHFDFSYLVPSLIGFWIISFITALFIEWINTGRKNNMLISVVGAMTISFLFIIATWVAADWILVFTGVHRYLTIPAIASSFMVSAFVTIAFNKLKKNKKLNALSYMVFLPLIPFIIFNISVGYEHFRYELEFAGTDAPSHVRMKDKLWSFLGNISETKPSIFYFDESADHDNGYFDETTTMAGFSFWMRFRGQKIVKNELTPALLRSNLICSEERSMCLSKVKEILTEQNGVKGIKYGTIFYNIEDFYAFRFIDRNIVDIKEEVLEKLGL